MPPVAAAYHKFRVNCLLIDKLSHNTCSFGDNKNILFIAQHHKFPRVGKDLDNRYFNKHVPDIMFLYF